MIQKTLKNEIQEFMDPNRERNMRLKHKCVSKREGEDFYLGITRNHHEIDKILLTKLENIGFYFKK